MPRQPHPSFAGFSRQSVQFLRRVRKENSKRWFEEHREVYENVLLHPLQDLVADLTPLMLRIDPMFEVRPAVDRTLSRIRRDTRFSADKSLYRDTMWLTFKRPRADWTGAPAFFFELAPASYRYGMGYYEASRSTMDAMRAKIDGNRRSFRRAVAPLVKDGRFELKGEKYRRPLPSSHPEEVQDWYQRKTFYLVREHRVGGRLFLPLLAKDLATGFQCAGPLYQYLLRLQP